LEQFNYFREIEGAFVRRRGRNLLLSPVDWALIESWEQKGVPLRIVLSTIDEVFDHVDSDPAKAASIRSLSYCKDAVEARYRTWREGNVGEDSGEVEPVPQEVFDHGESESESGSVDPDAGHLARALGVLEKVMPLLEGAALEAADAARKHLSAAVGTAGASAERLLDEADNLIDDVLVSSLTEAELEIARESAKKQVVAGGPPAGAGERSQASDMLLRKRLRDDSGVPLLGLFRL